MSHSKPQERSRTPFPFLLFGFLIAGHLVAQVAQEPAPEGDYLPPALRQQVEALKQVARTQPTTVENIVERTRTLWPWANAYALAGHPLHPDFSSSVARIFDPDGLNRRGRDTLPALVDDWIEEFSFRENNPGALGTLSSPDLGPFPVDQYATLVQTLRVGSAGVDTGGGVMVTPIAYGRSTANMQWSDPAADNYLRVFTSNPDAKLSITTEPMSGMTSGGLRGVDVPRPVFQVSEGKLSPGDIITIVLGDRSGGSRGMMMPTMSSSGLRIKVWLRLTGDGVFFPFDELAFRVAGGATAGVRGFAPTVVAVGEPFDLLVRSEDQFRNRATSDFPGYELRIDGRVWKTLPDGLGALQILRGVTFDQPRVVVIEIRSTDGRLVGAVNPILVEREPKRRVFWGETHGHSGFAEGMGTVDGFFEFARDDARLDFMTLSEHDLWLDDSEWQILLEAVERYHREGQFVTFAGYEWTQHARAGGHHNVLFRTPEQRRRVERQRAPRLLPLYTLLLEENREDDVLVIPHAHNPGNWWTSDGRIERQVEIVSNHGTFEWLGRAYLAEGHRTGFLGGSDDHIGHPGLRPLWKNRGSDNRGGLAGVVASEKTRDAIFDALRQRASYATNGERIFLEARLGSAQMGTVTADSGEIRFSGRVVGTAPIESIVVVKNGRDFETISYANTTSPSRTVEVSFFSQTDPEERRVWSRGAQVWRGKIELEGAELEGVLTPNVENVYTEGAKLVENEKAGEDSVGSSFAEFDMRTRGAVRSVLLELGPTELEALHIDLQRDDTSKHRFVAEELLGDGTILRIEDEKYVDTVRVRFVDPPSEIDRSFEVIDESGRAGDNYFVRVTQWNGGMAWSSPTWLAKETP